MARLPGSAQHNAAELKWDVRILADGPTPRLPREVDSPIASSDPVMMASRPHNRTYSQHRSGHGNLYRGKAPEVFCSADAALTSAAWGFLSNQCKGKP